MTKELNDFQATLVMRRALKTDNIDITEDPLYKDFKQAEWEKQLSKYTCYSLSGVLSSFIIYKFRFQRRLNWTVVLGRCISICSLFTFAYWTCPGMRKYNEALIEISKSRRQELKKIVDEKPKEIGNLK